jgi:hypothetical protein
MERFQLCIQSAWEYYTKNFQKDQFRLEKRTRAGIIRDIMIDYVKQLFHGVDNISISNSNGLFLLIINESIVIKFKKLKSDYTPSNVPTTQTNLFLQGELFPEYEKMTYLHVGYVVNDSWEYIAMCISCTDGRVVHWIINLDQHDIISNDKISPIEELELDSEFDIKNVIKQKQNLNNESVAI